MIALLATCAAVTWVASGGRGQTPARDFADAAAKQTAPKPAPQEFVATPPAPPAPWTKAGAQTDPVPQVVPNRPIIVIDPGHGGSNSGAVAIVPTVLEKQITLAIAEMVAGQLAQAGMDVRLTRADDRALTLRERVEFAELSQADLFISVHANASPSRQQQGFETYVLSARAIDVDAPALRHDMTRPRPGIDPATAQVLDDIERGVSQWRSIDIAERVQREMAKARPGSPNRGIRQDSQHVLLGATMPAVLVEVGFIDHPREGRELMTHSVQAGIADALARSVTSWVRAKAERPYN